MARLVPFLVVPTQLSSVGELELRRSPAIGSKLIFFAAIVLVLMSAVVGLVRGRTSFPRRHPGN